MSFVFERAAGSVGDSFAGGIADLGGIFDAARDAMRFVDNTNAAHAALERAYDERIETLRRLTGRTAQNPLRAAEEDRRDAAATPRLPGREPLSYAERVGRARRDFDRQVEDAARQMPDQSAVQELYRPIERDAERIARDAEGRFDRLFSARDGLGRWAALLAGGGLAALRDPVQVASLAIGAGPGAGRTVVARILSVAIREAAINGATEAAMQPIVQAWRERAGLEHGTDMALRNVAFATVLGGVFGGALAGAGEAAGRLFGRNLDAAATAAASTPSVSPEMRAALAGDTAAARAMLPEIRAALPAPARGALDHGEMLDHMDGLRPAGASPARHEAAVTAAHRAAAVDLPIEIQPDRAQIERITREIVGPQVAPARETRQSLVDFLAARGGLLDTGGDLDAVGARRLARKPRGKDRRQSLDMAREAAEQAGYIGRDGEYQTTTVRELVDAIDAELRGRPVYSRFDAEPDGRGADEATIAGIETMVADVARHAGPGVDDRLIREAAELALAERVDPFDALESVLIRAEGAAHGPQRAGDPLPGWSDAELEAASAGRPLSAEPDGIDDPAHFVDEDMITTRDIAEFGDMDIAGEEGRVVSLAAYARQLEHEDDLARLVGACRV